ncbi:MAG: sigma-70 family RNA polymerase sigma factor [Cyclobacteriaceae bacterium]
MQDPTDAELIKKSKNGDIESFKTLVIRKEGKVARVLMVMLGDPMLAEDIGQEIFVRLHKSLDKVRADVSVDSYLLRLAIDYSLDAIKRQKKYPHFATVEHLGNKSLRQAKDLNEQFQFEFSSLDPQQKLIATLRLVAGYSTEEISKTLQLPASTIISQLAMVQHKLRIALSNKLG